MKTRRKLGLAAATLVILVAAAAGAAQLWAQRTAKQRVDATIANLPQGETGHYDQLHYNLFNQRLHLVGLVITREGQTIFSAGRVTLLEASGAGTTDDPFRVGSANIADITTTQNGHHLTIDTLTATVLAGNGRHQVMTVQSGVDCPNTALHDYAEKVTPRLQDAYAQAH